MTAEGATQVEALDKLHDAITSKLRAGARFASLEIPTANNPWLRMAGMYDKHDPLVQEWIQIMQDNRRKDDEKENTP